MGGRRGERGKRRLQRPNGWRDAAANPAGRCGLRRYVKRGRAVCAVVRPIPLRETSREVPGDTKTVTYRGEDHARIRKTDVSFLHESKETAWCAH